MVKEQKWNIYDLKYINYICSGGICPGGICPEGICPGGICPRVHVWRVSVQGGIYPGVSVLGVHVQWGYVLEPFRPITCLFRGLRGSSWGGRYYMIICNVV